MHPQDPRQNTIPLLSIVSLMTTPVFFYGIPVFDSHETTYTFIDDLRGDLAHLACSSMVQGAKLQGNAIGSIFLP